MEEFLEEIENFLGGTFHQDIESIDEAIQECITDWDKEELCDLVKNMEKFLGSAMNMEQKNEFIQQNAEIYFPALNVTPLQWFISVKEIIEKSILKN